MWSILGEVVLFNDGSFLLIMYHLAHIKIRVLFKALALGDLQVAKNKNVPTVIFGLY